MYTINHNPTTKPENMNDKYLVIEVAEIENHLTLEEATILKILVAKTQSEKSAVEAMRITPNLTSLELHDALAISADSYAELFAEHHGKQPGSRQLMKHIKRVHGYQVSHTWLSQRMDKIRAVAVNHEDEKPRFGHLPTKMRILIAADCYREMIAAGEPISMRSLAKWIERTRGYKARFGWFRGEVMEEIKMRARRKI